MKKILIFILTILFSLNLFAETKTLYFTRHGQRGDPRYQVKFKYCDEDRLMPKGVEQAALLGAYLNQQNFRGTIYVSPYYRTLETATIAAKQLPEMPFIIESRIQERPGVKDNTGKIRKIKKCLTKKEIKENFPHAKFQKNFKWPWRIENEKQSQMDERCGKVIDDLIEKYPGDAFVVCHGGLLPGVIREMNKRGAEFPSTKVYNCCLYKFVVDTETKKVISWEDETLNYLPDELITDNLAYMLNYPKRNK